MVNLKCLVWGAHLLSPCIVCPADPLAPDYQLLRVPGQLPDAGRCWLALLHAPPHGQLQLCVPVITRSEIVHRRRQGTRLETVLQRST